MRPRSIVLLALIKELTNTDGAGGLRYTLGVFDTQTGKTVINLGGQVGE